MENKLEIFREKVKMRCYAHFAIIAVIMAVYIILELFFGGGKSDFSRGFLIGFVLSVTLSMAARAVLGLRIANNSEKIKEKYARENDEREISIRQKSGALGFWIVKTGVYIATVIAGYFDAPVFFTLMAVWLFIVLAQIAAHIIYRC